MSLFCSDPTYRSEILQTRTGHQFDRNSSTVVRTVQSKWFITVFFMAATMFTVPEPVAATARGQVAESATNDCEASEPSFMERVNQLAAGLDDLLLSEGLRVEDFDENASARIRQGSGCDDVESLARLLAANDMKELGGGGEGTER